MVTITKNRALERWDSLPPVLREALCSDINSDFVWKTCEAEFVPDEKIYSVARLVGYVLMGFLHPEDMASEIRSTIGVDLRIATPIANAINQRIFVPIRGDIDKIYGPAAAIAPKIIEEIRPAAKISPPVPAPFPIVPSGAPRPSAIPPPPKKEPTRIVSEKPPSLDEFANLKKPVPPSSPAPSLKPIVLQTESVSRPIPNAPNFKIPTIAENVMGGEKATVPLPTAPAVIEIGGVPTPKAAPAPKFSVSPPKSTGATPIMPPTPEPMRTITEITPDTLKRAVPTPKAPPPPPPFAPLSQIPVPSSSVPKPPAPSVPPPPKPSVPPGPIPKPGDQSGGIVQKNY